MRWGGTLKVFLVVALNSKNYCPSEIKALMKVMFEIVFPSPYFWFCSCAKLFCSTSNCEYLFYARICSKYFICIMSVDPHNNSMEWLSSPFYRWGNWGRDRLFNSHKDLQFMVFNCYIPDGNLRKKSSKTT